LERRKAVNMEMGKKELEKSKGNGFGETKECQGIWKSSFKWKGLEKEKAGKGK
jgi:hypothetical protein